VIARSIACRRRDYSCGTVIPHNETKLSDRRRERAWPRVKLL
jgi:hypothetical protein